MTNYYYIATDSLSNTWETAKIEKLLLSFDFLHKQNGKFSSKEPYLIVSLLKVSNKDSWNEQDYNKDKTNYISIITDDASERDIDVKRLLKGLEILLGFNIRPAD